MGKVTHFLNPTTSMIEDYTLSGMIIFLSLQCGLYVRRINEMFISILWPKFYSGEREPQRQEGQGNVSLS